MVVQVLVLMSWSSFGINFSSAMSDTISSCLHALSKTMRPLVVAAICFAAPLVVDALQSLRRPGFKGLHGSRGFHNSHQLPALFSSGNVCDEPSSVDSLLSDLGNQPDSGKLLRELSLTDADGKSVRLGDKMGMERAMVVFLRHLG